MLEELRLRGLGVIEDATLELGPGFTAITGETGAGKTMLLTGLSLLFGGRADSALVRPGHDRAEVDGRLVVGADSAAVQRTEQAGGALDDGALLIHRVIGAEGRSRAHAGGRPVPAAMLTELAEDLVAVHGQADQRGLLRPAVQRVILDRYAGAQATEALADYRASYVRLADLRRELHEVVQNRRERAQEADALRLGLAEIAAVAPVAGEEAALRLELSRLGQSDLLRRVADTAHAALSADDTDIDALGLVATARRALGEALGVDPALDALAERLAEVSYLLSDAAADLGGYLAGIDADPQRLQAAQERLSALTSLTRKYAEDVDGVIAWAQNAQRRLAELDDDGRAERLSVEHQECSRLLAAAGRRLTQLRQDAADRLQDAVGVELTGLSMPHATLQVCVAQRDDEHGLALDDGRRVAFGPHGLDEVELRLVAHRGAPARPLHKGASGGELSRIMLAIEVVLAGSDPVPTFVFDEVDAGVGGRAAVEIGRRLAALARQRQVLVVTHLPQVAAFADRHLVVDKDDAGATVTTVVRRVDGEQRIAELARMLSGLPESELGRGHAEELLAVAASAKTDGEVWQTRPG